MNIQDWLYELGYLESQKEEAFVKPPTSLNGWRQQSIPFSAVAGHTLDSFKKLAEKERWVEKGTAMENQPDFQKNIGPDAIKVSWIDTPTVCKYSYPPSKTREFIGRGARLDYGASPFVVLSDAVEQQERARQQLIDAAREAAMTFLAGWQCDPGEWRTFRARYDAVGQLFDDYRTSPYSLALFKKQLQQLQTMENQ